MRRASGRGPPPPAARKSGTAVFYRIADPAALKVIGVLAEIFCPPEAR